MKSAPQPQNRARRPSLLVDAFDIAQWLEQDESLAWQARVERDREALRRSDGCARDALGRVRDWWSQIERGAKVGGSGTEISRFFRRLDRIMLGLGLLSGFGLANAVLYYDGSHPLNVLVVLGWLVLLPLGLLVVSAILMLVSPARMGRASSLAGLLGSVLRRRYRFLDEFFQRAQTDRARGKLLAARLLQTSQVAGAGFALAALVVSILKISFSDLAFGWSTTLSVDSNTMSTVVTTIAWPWATWLPEAVPSHELIEQSRYFRLQQNADMLEAGVLTSWWRFLAMCLIVYGVLPRTLTWIAARMLCRKSARRLLLAHPQVRALLDRLDTPAVSASALDAPEIHVPTSQTAAAFAGDENAAIAILWNGVSEPAGYSRTINAGGDHTLDADIAALADLTVAPGARVDVVAKAWEPPMLELHDYLRALRDRCGDEVSIVVRPLDENGDPANERDRLIWARAMTRLDDAGTYVQ